MRRARAGGGLDGGPGRSAGRRAETLAVGPGTAHLVEVPPGAPQLTDDEDDVAPDDRVRCAACRVVVTQGRLAVRRGGAHQHTFRNPAGYSWTVRCFRDAAGCGSDGAFTGEATWFTGYKWCYAVCKACSRHLGWWFVGTGPPFVALISSRITAG